MRPLSPPGGASDRDGQRFLLDLDRRLERFDRSILVTDWNFFTGRSSQGSAAEQLERARWLSNPQLLDWVRGRLDRDWPALLHRRLELLERVLLDTQVEQDPEVVRLRSRLQDQIVRFRPRWKGKRANRTVLHRALEASARESDRQAAYYGLEALHRPLEEPLRELVRLRNEGAKAQGFRSFSEMRLGFQGLTPARIEEISEEVAGVARPRFRLLRDVFAAETGQGSWHPWDFPYARHQRVPLPDRLFPRRGMLGRVLAALRSWGFRVERRRFRVVFHDLPSGGLTLAPDPPTDVRILVHPQGGWTAYLAMFHEVGHAVHSASIRAPRHLLRWHENVPGFGGFHEGVAGLFEGLASRAAWLTTQRGIAPETAKAFERVQRDAKLLSAAWVASWLRIEQLLYERPERDPMPMAQRFERRLFGYDAYEPLSFVDPFFVGDPVYAPNYLLATLFSQELVQALRQRFGEPFWPNARVGPWLTREWFAAGSRYDWVPRLKKVTRRPFGTHALIELAT